MDSSAYLYCTGDLPWEHSTREYAGSGAASLALTQSALDLRAPLASLARLDNRQSWMEPGPNITYINTCILGSGWSAAAPSPMRMLSLKSQQNKTHESCCNLRPITL